MNQSIDDLYRAELLELAADAKNMIPLQNPTAEATRYNSICGDMARVSIKTDLNQISDLSISMSGCVICSASASIMCRALVGVTKKQAKAVIKQATEIITSGKNDAENELDLLKSVSRFPNRVRCAMLAWEALDAAIGEKSS